MRRAAALRREQRLIEADALITEAKVLAPDDRLIAFLHAQSRYELGYPAAALFEAAQALWPDNRDIMRNRSLALASEGRSGEAEAILVDALAREPDWIEGHRVLANLRRVHALPTRDDTSYEMACADRRAPPALWLAWFAHAAQQKQWDEAASIVDRAEAWLGRSSQFDAARAVVACESGSADQARTALAAVAASADPMLAIARSRFHLKQRNAAAAEAALLPLLSTAAALQAWPYLGLAWRVRGDTRHHWLEGDPRLVGICDIGLSARELNELAMHLRALHIAHAPYPDQSVRGGTQTDRSILLRHELIFQRTRAALMSAVERHVAQLPPTDPRHPLLSRPRNRLSIAGSWSVRLDGGGRNVPHTHPMGWLSSAFYVALPEDEPAPAGQLLLGAPPEELELDLPPLRSIASRVGQLVLFPSTMWHATVPFARGERLNIAFDIVPG